MAPGLAPAAPRPFRAREDGGRAALRQKGVESVGMMNREVAMCHRHCWSNDLAVPPARSDSRCRGSASAPGASVNFFHKMEMSKKSGAEVRGSRKITSVCGNGPGPAGETPGKLLQRLLRRPTAPDPATPWAWHPKSPIWHQDWHPRVPPGAKSASGRKRGPAGPQPAPNALKTA